MPAAAPLTLRSVFILFPHPPHIIVICSWRADAPAKPAKPSKHYLFHDENLPSFFRRLSWSPDGSFLAVPAGMFKAAHDSRAVNTTYIFRRGSW